MPLIPAKANSSSDRGKTIKTAAKALEAEGYVRLIVPGNTENYLELVGGTGEYYKWANVHRKVIGTDDSDSQSARCVRENRRILNNNAELSNSTPLTRAGSADGECQILKGVQAYVDFPIAPPGGAPIGVVNFSSDAPWFFTQSRLRRLEDIGHRLYLLVVNLRHKQEEEQRKAELAFLSEIRPAFNELNLHEALRHQVERMKKAAGAEVVSCYLWDNTQDCFVLRAQAGWKDEGLVGKAYYEKNEGMTGCLATCQSDQCHGPQYIDDIEKKWRDVNLPGVSAIYWNQMFGKPLQSGVTCEVIALPLQFKGKALGIVTMHRLKVESEHRPGFVTTNCTILRDAAENLSAFVAALQDHDLTAWEREEQQRFSAVTKVLLDPENDDLTSLLSAVCRQIVVCYGARRAAIYLEEPDYPARLVLAAQAFREGCEESLPRQVEADEDPVKQAYLLGEMREVRRQMLATVRNKPATDRKPRTIHRVCIPLFVSGSGNLLGILDLGWKGIRSINSPILAHHSPGHLQQLGRRIANSTYMHRLREDHDRTRRAALRASRSLAGMQTYLADNFHELNDDVQSLQDTLELIIGCPADRRDMLLERCSATIESLKSRLKSARNRGRILASGEWTTCRLYHVLAELVRKEQEKFSGGSIVLHCSKEIQNLEMRANPDQIRQCFRYLIENSIKAVSSNAVIEVTMHNQKEQWVIKVSDNGRGLPRHVVRAITRKRPVKQADGRGGNGLYMAQLFCDVHGGSLKVEKTNKWGTVLKVTLPLKEMID